MNMCFLRNSLFIDEERFMATDANRMTLTLQYLDVFGLLKEIDGVPHIKLLKCRFFISNDDYIPIQEFKNLIMEHVDIIKK